MLVNQTQAAPITAGVCVKSDRVSVTEREAAARPRQEELAEVTPVAATTRRTPS
jgi:hypothetical protein